MSHKIIQLPSFNTERYQNENDAIDRMKYYIASHSEDFVPGELFVINYKGADTENFPVLCYCNTTGGVIEDVDVKVISFKDEKKNEKINIELDIEPTYSEEDRVDVTEIFGDQFSYETADNYIINSFALLSKEGTPDGWCRCAYGGFYAGDPKDGLGYRILEVMYFIVKEKNGNIYAELIDNRE